MCEKFQRNYARSKSEAGKKLNQILSACMYVCVCVTSIAYRSHCVRVCTCKIHFAPVVVAVVVVFLGGGKWVSVDWALGYKRTT